MGLVILGGLFKGHSLFLPNKISFRPTSVMLRRKIFDANQNLTNFVFVDLFAGSGAMGFEALSRGADQVYLNEKNKKNYHRMKECAQNLLQKFGLAPSVVKLENSSFDTFLQQMILPHLDQWVSQGKQVIFFIDPPYTHKQCYQKSVDLIIDALKLKQDSQNEANNSIILWLESCYQKGIKENHFEQILKLQKLYKQGTSFIGVYEVKKNESV